MYKIFIMFFITIEINIRYNTTWRIICNQIITVTS